MVMKALRAGELQAESSLCCVLALFVGLVEVSLKGVIGCSLTAALVTVPVRDDLLDAAGTFLVVVLLLPQPILSANLFC